MALSAVQGQGPHLNLVTPGNEACGPIKPRTSPETFIADFMATPLKPGNEAAFPALRRELIHVAHAIINRLDTRTGGGFIFRRMIEAGQMTVCEAIKEIVEWFEAEANTDAALLRDPITKPIFQRFTKAKGEREMALGAQLHDQTRRITAEMLRADGEIALADLYEFFPATCELMVAFGKETLRTDPSIIEPDYLEAFDDSRIMVMVNGKVA